MVRAFVFHGIFVVNLFCYSFFLVKRKNNLTCTAYFYSAFILAEVVTSQVNFRWKNYFFSFAHLVHYFVISAMLKNSLIILLLLVTSCKTPHQLALPERKVNAIGGNAFYKTIAAMKWNEREPMMINEILSGNVPKFLQRLVPIHVMIKDTAGKVIHATYFVTPDYLSIGSNNDFARIPMTPMAAQQIADSLHCFLPTRKMVNDIYAHAKIKLEPLPMFAYRDSGITFYQHHLMIEGQRKGRHGLIAGIKKDVVISSKITSDPKPNRVAIYGWHKLDGNAIQPLYTGHINWYVDYSHGIRLVYRTIIVDGKQYDYTEVLKNEKLRKLLCDEEDCSFYRY